MRDLTLESSTAPVARKGFGTFLGVFTPSLLTILGVIMYQRLGWVVGHAGVAGSLVVIALAHVISITTGLSVASIATNRTVRTGGNYYIISRSLGLSVGGAIGLALYAALALGVSLYVIGFAEAFLAAVDVAPFESDVQNIRFIGSSALAVLALLTWTSTTLAIRTQLFVLAAIAVSVGSILLGGPVEVDAGQAHVGLNPPTGSADLATVFSVFFPAVTGFTAGVGMSGDLKNPKRSIPLGTMLAIGVGLVVYVALAALLAAWVPVEPLQQDYNILRRVAAYPELVTAGVFAATFSSALGSLLGAPRTLQALSFDGILPNWVAWGEREPRMALAITLVIAEAGILIARLDVVGSVITMFFLTCYGCLCLACGLERWASPDFRPQFKVPIWVSLAGAVACFLVMFRIDPLAMFAAVAFMGLLYAGLKRRQLVLGTGDTWGGVWSAVVRMGLMRLQRSSSRSAQRNWRPTMLVVGRQRPQNPLLDFGTQLVGDRGILTHIHLKEGEPPNPRPDKVLEEAYPGIFARIQGCRDVYDAIPELAAHFGLVGMETNSVLLGWPQLASQRTRYAQMIDRLVALDLSVLMLRYDEQRRFGTREQLDIWWDGEAPTGPLMLTLAHMLTTHPDWKHTRVRVLVNGRRGQDEDRAQRALDAIIQESRVQATGVLLPPVEDEEGLAARIRQESSRADLVMIHARQPHEDLGFVGTNDALMRPLGTTLLVRPSTFFAQKATVFEAGTIDLTTAGSSRVSVPASLPALLEPLQALQQRLADANERFARSFDRPAHEEEVDLLADLTEAAEQIRQLERRLERRGSRKTTARGLLEWAQSRFLSAAEERVRAPFRPPGQVRESKEPWERRLLAGFDRLREDVERSVQRLPDGVEVPTELEDWLPRAGDPMRLRLRKAWVRTWVELFRRPHPSRFVAVRRPAAALFAAVLPNDLRDALRVAGQRRLEAVHRARRLVQSVQRLFDNLQAELDQEGAEAVDVDRLAGRVSRQLTDLLSQARDQLEAQRAEDEKIQSLLGARLEDAASRLSDELRRHGSAKRPGPSAPVDPSTWTERHRASLQALRLDLQVEACVVEGRRGLSALEVRLRRELEQGPLGAIEQAVEVMQRIGTLRERYESGDPEGDGADEVPVWNETFVQAADELRTAFDRAYRPDVAEMTEQLLAHLARGAERLPLSATVPVDGGLEHAEGDRPGRSSSTVPARRLAQAHLESRVVRFVQRELQPLPEAVRAAEEVLVDAVRLVAFELEQAAAAEREDRSADLEEAGTLALGGILEERIRRLNEARDRLVGVLGELRDKLGGAALQRVEAVRSAVFRTSGAGTAAPVARSRSVGRLVRSARDKAADVRGRALQMAEGLRPQAGGNRGSPSTVVDGVLRLREALEPNPEVQANLPLLYRRIFGRSALENRDLLVGRDRELDALNELAERWARGHTGPVGIVGLPRSGRTSLSTVWAREREAPLLRIPPPSGGPRTADGLNEVISRTVGARAGQSAEGALRTVAPGSVILVDDLGAWIERSVEGLQALKLWLRLFRRLGDRHLFCVSMTPWVRDFCAAAVGLEEVLLGSVPCKALDRGELERALLLRQRTTDFELEFARTSRFRGPGQSQKAHLDRLHLRSRGNVGEAVDSWRRSVTHFTERRVGLSVSAAPDPGVLGRLPVRWKAVLGALAFHRGLSAAQLARSFRMPREEAQAVLSDLGRASLVRSDRNGAHSIDPVLQAPLLDVLRQERVLS